MLYVSLRTDDNPMRLFIALFALVVSQMPQSPPKPPTATELRFAWPENITAMVETERTKVRNRGTESKRTTLRLRYRMQVLPDAKGRLIRYRDYEILEPLVPAKDTEGLSQMLSALLPNIVVNVDGSFARVEDIAPLREFVKALAQPLAKDAEAHAATKELFPDMSVKMKGTLRMVARRECTRASALVSCATFEMSTSADPQSVGALLKRILDAARNMEGVTFEQYDLRTILRVTLETATMLPHALALTKTASTAMSIPGEGRVEIDQADKTIMTFTYPSGR
jgi:hypothetical protein